MQLDEALVSKIVDSVMAKIESASAKSNAPRPQMVNPTYGCGPNYGSKIGCYDTVDEAVTAATAAFQAYHDVGLEKRKEIISYLKVKLLQHAEEFSKMAVEETKIGRVEDKIKKNRLAISATPGPEFLETHAMSGTYGLTIEERAPFGVIGSITPTTNPTETIINNGIAMVSGGNTVVFNPHPSAKGVSAHCVQLMNRYMTEAGAPPNLITCIAKPSIESAGQLMKHSGIRLLVVTGGPAVVKAAFASGKKVICGGPGNPPVVVDETADLEQAAKGIVAGASFDNNLICCDEKEVIAVDSIADKLKSLMCQNSAYELKGAEIKAVEKLVVDGTHPNKDYVGKDAAVILKAAGITPPPGDLRLIFADVPFEHPFIQLELLMPVIGFTRARDVDQAIELAVKAERGCGHTASMYSKNIDNLHRMAVAVNCSIFVKNGPNYSGLGFEGEGWTSWTIASPTGEGLTNPISFTRIRRCVLKGHFRIV